MWPIQAVSVAPTAIGNLGLVVSAKKKWVRCANLAQPGFDGQRLRSASGPAILRVSWFALLGRRSGPPPFSFGHAPPPCAIVRSLGAIPPVQPLFNGCAEFDVFRRHLGCDFAA